MIPPFADGKDPNFKLEVNGKIIWEWRTLEGCHMKLFNVLQANLMAIGYKLEVTAFGSNRQRSER